MTEFDPSGGKIIAAPMPLSRFEALIAAYGVAPERWPAAQRAAADTLIEHSAEARDALADAALLDHLLARDEAPAPSEDLTGALRRRFTEAGKPRRMFRWRGRSRSLGLGSRPGLSFAGAAAIVVMAMAIGYWSTDSTPASGPVVARALPPIELGGDGFVDENGPLEPEIALIDFASMNAAFGQFSDQAQEPELTLASGPSLDDLPLD
jgi:hypothetical protein